MGAASGLCSVLGMATQSHKRIRRSGANRCGRRQATMHPPLPRRGDQTAPLPPNTGPMARNSPKDRSRSNAASTRSLSKPKWPGHAKSIARHTREHQPRWSAGQIDHQAALPCGKDHQSCGLRLQGLQGDIGAQRVRRASAIEMRAALVGIMHVTAKHRNHTRLMRRKCPIGCRKRHGSASINKPAIGILRRNKLFLCDDCFPICRGRAAIFAGNPTGGSARPSQGGPARRC